MNNEKHSNKTLIKKVINIKDINNLSDEELKEYFNNVLKYIYDYETIDKINEYSNICLDMVNSSNNTKKDLPDNIILEKKNSKFIIKSKSKKSVLILLLFFLLLLLASIGASYSYINYNSLTNINKDVDKDKIPDINIDLNDDKIPEINVDTNNDKKPDYNIDYKGNRKPIFNIDTNHNGKADYNLINVDKNKDGICDLNCDTDNDGWPDINLDIDGDGKADLFIDTNNDKKPDLNFDQDRDMICDLHCDTNGDGKCDKNCLLEEQIKNVTPSKNGTSKVVGKDNSNKINSGDLILEFVDENTVYITDIFPDDQPMYTQEIPTKKFSVTNKSGAYIFYNLKWVIDINDFVSDNFKYSVTSTLNGANFDFKTTPKSTSTFATNISIPPYSTQDYEINFKLEGTGDVQNEDQERTFKGHIEVYVD